MREERQTDRQTELTYMSALPYKVNLCVKRPIQVHVKQTVAILTDTLEGLIVPVLDF